MYMHMYIHTCMYTHSYVGVTIGPTSKYSSEPYDRSKEMRNVSSMTVWTGLTCTRTCCTCTCSMFSLLWDKAGLP